jgi:hypothetical protein
MLTDQDSNASARGDAHITIALLGFDDLKVRPLCQSLAASLPRCRTTGSSGIQ